MPNIKHDDGEVGGISGYDLDLLIWNLPFIIFMLHKPKANDKMGFQT
jgi:hypothetical protein